MKMKSISLKVILPLGAAILLPMLTACGGGSTADKTADSITKAATEAAQEAATTVDSTLQQLAAVAPLFKSDCKYTDKSGNTVNYKLYTPANDGKGKSYPLVVSLSGSALTDNYGALVAASGDWQKAASAYVLVPEFTAKTLDNGKVSSEATALAELLKSGSVAGNIDNRRVYLLADGEGSDLALCYNSTNALPVAATVYVGGTAPAESVTALAKQRLVYFAVDKESPTVKYMESLGEACRNAGTQYVWSAWSAQLPQQEQNSLAEVMLQKGAPVNLFQFENGVSGNQAAAKYAYCNQAVRDWLFKQKR